MTDRRESVQQPRSVDGRPPPSNLEAERAVLSAVMVDPGDPLAHRPSAMASVVDLVRAEHFYSEAHRRIFEACVALFEAGQPTDSVCVATWLRERDRLGQVGGMPYLAESLLAAPSVTSVRSYAEAVVDAHLVRQTILACQRSAAEGYLDFAEEHGDARGYVGSVVDRVMKIAESANRSHTTEHVRSILKRYITTVQAAAASGRGITGRPTGLSAYDRLTAGLHPGDLTIVAARPGVGKTSLVGGWAESAACGDLSRAVLPAGVLFCSLEMPRDQIALRMACARGGIDVGLLRSGNISPAAMAKLMTAAVELAKLPLWIDDQASTSLVDLRAKVRWARSECARVHVTLPSGAVMKDDAGKPVPVELGLVVVDYLQLMKGHGDTREQEVSSLARGLKAIAKDERLPVVALSQLNRAVESRGGEHKRPMLSDLRESGAIEQDADNICFVWRQCLYDRNADQNEAELILAKQRNGATDTVKVRFDREYTRFSDLESEGFYRDDPDERTGGCGG